MKKAWMRLRMPKALSLTEFQRNSKSIIARVRRERSPQMLTVRGRAAAVLIDPDSYDELMEGLDQRETLEAIRKGLEAVERGDVRPVKDFLDEFCGERKIERPA